MLYLIAYKLISCMIRAG